MEFDFRKLTALIIAYYGSREAFAKELGISKSSLSMKLNNKSKFSILDITRSCELLSIPQDSIGSYFFDQKVHKCEQEG